MREEGASPIDAQVSPEDLEVEVELQDQDLLEASGIHALRRNVLVIVLVFGIAVVGASFARGLPPILGLIGPAAGGLFVLLVAFVVLLTRRVVRSYPEDRRQYRLRFGSSGVDVVSSVSRGHIAWEGFVRHLEKPTHFLLFPQDNLWMVVPKRGLSEGEQTKLRRILIERIGRGAPARSPVKRTVAIWVVLLALVFGTYAFYGARGDASIGWETPASAPR